ncbi:hypothetical protein [Legionella micdadei]|uniref:hypothetical protein n=1 Tax=Legionella micdadei TaxID=451 RepID=UPI0009EF7472|nr:hypothetical protein [Legionella micdadei]ARH01140.1 hypothetical protein B6V88_12380 [Legionella micdadei]
MECILSHYPAGTQFYILTRVFNTDAKNLYGKRLGFEPIEEKEVSDLGYDARYCGFKHTTTVAEVEAIKARQTTLVHTGGVVTPYNDSISEREESARLTM